MTSALVVLAAALLALPSSVSRPRLLAILGSPERVRRRIPWPPIAVVAGVPAALFTVGVFATVAVAVVGGTAWLRHVRGRAARVHDADVNVLLSGLEVMTAELRVGAHPAAACQIAAEECAGEPATVFRAASARARLGGSASEGFLVPDSRVAAEFERIANVWSVAEQHGLALAELLEAARSDLLGRKRFRQRTEAGLAGARATAGVLAGLPLVGIGLGQLMGASPLRVLLGGGLGGMMLVLGCVLVCAGLLWTDRITSKVTR